MITRSDWDTVSRQHYTAEDQAAIDAFLDEWGHAYDDVTNAITDFYATR